jgi:hypothetical protein
MHPRRALALHGRHGSRRLPPKFGAAYPVVKYCGVQHEEELFRLLTATVLVRRLKEPDSSYRGSSCVTIDVSSCSGHDRAASGRTLEKRLSLYVLRVCAPLCRVGGPAREEPSF